MDEFIKHVKLEEKIFALNCIKNGNLIFYDPLISFKLLLRNMQTYPKKLAKEKNHKCLTFFFLFLFFLPDAAASAEATSILLEQVRLIKIVI